MKYEITKPEDKHFKDNMPETTCKLTQKGLKAYEQYARDISGYPFKDDNSGDNH